MDRIDIHVDVPAVKYEKIADEKDAEPSLKIRERVNKARLLQIKRSNKTNSEINSKELKSYCVLDEKSKGLLKSAMNQLHLSVRQYSRIIKVARTIADLEGKENIESSHIAEALQYRPKERSIY